MSVDLYACPIPAALPLLSNPDCPAIYGNVSAVALQLKQGTPSFTSTSIALLATWTPLLASATATGIRIIPCTNFATTPGEAITEGGNDQTTFKGRQKLKYVGFSTGTYRMEGVTSAFAKAVVAYTKFSAMAGGRSNLRMFLLTDENNIISGADFNGVEVWNHVVMDVTKGGAYKLEDNYNVNFGMDYGWSFDAVTTKAAFDVLALVNA
jgi:hypothetical protein